MLGPCLLGGWRSPAATVTWTNTSGGSWLAPENWDPNQVPTGLTDTAVITNSGTYTVTLGSGLAIANITLGAAGGTGIQTLSWSGGTLSDCSLTIAAKGVLNLNGSTDKALRRCKVNNAGTITWSGTGQLLGAVDGYNQSVLITNLAGGLFDFQTDANLGYSDPGYGIAAYVLHNAGALEVGLLPNLAVLGQTFAAMSYGTSTGAFSSGSGLQLDGGLWLRPALTAHELTLTVESAPKFSIPQFTAGGFKLQWQGAPGVTCRLDASTNLLNWLTLLSTNTPDGLGVYVDADSLVLPRRFYRLTPQ